MPKFLNTFVINKFYAPKLQFLKAKHKIEENHFRHFSPTVISGKVSDHNLQSYSVYYCNKEHKFFARESYFLIGSL